MFHGLLLKINYVKCTSGFVVLEFTVAVVT